MIYTSSAQSMSTEELTDGEYDNGELIAISMTSPLVQAILYEPWLNVSNDQREVWLSELSSPRVKFAGTVLSHVRKQVELTLIYRDQNGETSHQRSICISLADFDRFL